MDPQCSFGVDVGGSSLKYAPVDTGSGRLLSSLAATPTPQPAAPGPLVAAIAALAANAPAGAPLGVALPSVIRRGTIFTAANVDRTLIGFDIEAALRTATGRRVACLNDADAAGLAEVRLGAARGHQGTVMVLTFGTGIGSALFIDGQLVPNTELGHLQMGGEEAEHRASARVRTAEGLDWAQWAVRVSEYLDLINGLFWPELIVMGGGVSEEFDHFGSLLRSRAPVRAAQLGPAAGVVGAAMAAREKAP